MQTITVYSYLRFSTVIQAEGASLRRQIECTKKWLEAKAKNNPDEGPYVLDTKLRLADEGVSAYRGKNTMEGGALAGFLKAVDTGSIAKGSFLVVESLDRLSREQVTIALGLFLSIIGRGITIVTLVDAQEYSQATLEANPYPIVMSIITMIRAHEESAMKGKRVAHAWEEKREDAVNKGKALTRQCPAWLQVEGGVKSEIRTYTRIESRVKIVQRIFELIASGWGQGRIAATLTKEGVLPWGPGRRQPGTDKKPPRGTRWHDSYIMLISKNRAVLGELQLYKGDGKSNREPVGDPIQNYYPAIISPELFAKVQAVRLSRKVHGFVGRQGVNISNLFQGLVYDIKSGQRCVYVSHGRTENWQYLTPPLKEEGQKGWNYHRFENAFVEHCRLLNWTEIFGGTNHEAVSAAEREIEAARAEFARIDTLITRYADAVATAPDVQILVGKLRTLEESKGAAQKALRLAIDAHGTALARQEALETDASRIKLMASGGLTTPESRLRLREEIRRVVTRIDASFSKRGGHYMIVTYANGAMRYLYPSKDGQHVRIHDRRECGFMGTPEEWQQGAAALENDDSGQDEAAS